MKHQGENLYKKGELTMWFDTNEVEQLPSYGRVVSAHTFLKRLEEELRNNRIIFEADYGYGDFVNFDKAMEMLINIKNLNKY